MQGAAAAGSSAARSTDLDEEGSSEARSMGEARSNEVDSTDSGAADHSMHHR